MAEELKDKTKQNVRVDEATRPEGREIPNVTQLERQMSGADRKHFESLGGAWIAVTGIHPQALIPQVVGTVLSAGGTRPSWNFECDGLEHILLAWPKDQAVRAAVLMRGEKGGALKPLSSLPLLEGLPNTAIVEQVHPWENGGGANVGVSMESGAKPMWFYDPLYLRDREDLTLGVEQTFLIAGLAFGVRKALLDEITITQGPEYELYAKAWLQEHPDSSRLDVPALKLDVSGKHVIHPGNAFGEYQMRATIEDVETCTLDKTEISILYTRFPFAKREPLILPIYASKVVLKDYEPKSGDDIDCYCWLQGRILDWEEDA